MGRRVLPGGDQRVEALDGQLRAAETQQRVRGRDQPEGGRGDVPLHRVDRVWDGWSAAMAMAAWSRTQRGVV